MPHYLLYIKSSLLVPHFFNVVCLIDSIRVSVPVFDIGCDWAFGVGICETWTAGTWVGMVVPVWLWRPDRGKEPGVSAMWLIGLAGVVFILCDVPVWKTNLERFSNHFLPPSATITWLIEADQSETELTSYRPMRSRVTIWKLSWLDICSWVLVEWLLNVLDKSRVTFRFAKIKFQIFR